MEAPVATRLAPALAGGAAPWQSIERAKLPYNVFRAYAPPELAAQFDRPIADPAQRGPIVARAASFASGARRLALTIVPDAIIDVGAARPGDANVVALVDLERSPQLQPLVLAGPGADAASLAIDPESHYAIPVMSVAFVRDGAGVGRYGATESLTLTVVPKDLGRVTVWRLDGRAWRRVVDVAATGSTQQDPAILLGKLSTRAKPVFGGLGGVAAKAALDPAGVTTLTLEALARGLQPAASKGEAPQAAPPEAPATGTRYDAYGAFGSCTRYCTRASCERCCGSLNGAANLAIGNVALACHLLSDLCPWCHAGCAGNTAAMLTIAGIEHAACRTSCSMRSTIEVRLGNPRNCPIY
jgi:hypothetical protein